jgi:hypothetical protein
VDTTKPVLTITGGVPIRTAAARGASNATVAFPNMTATDNFTPEPTINCTGNFAGSPLTFLAKDAASQTGVFPVSGTATTVTCFPRDAARNVGAAVKFTVTVGCPAGFSISSGACRGAAEGGTHWA